MTVVSLAYPISSQRCFVRVRAIRPDGFVEFDFSIGHPDLAVDLILPLRAFHEFCTAHRVQFLTEEEGENIDREKVKWRYGSSVLVD